MEQQIRFCTGADGTRVAYATAGSGRTQKSYNRWPTGPENT